MLLKKSSHHKLFLATLLLLCVSDVFGRFRCHNHCSGHGFCSDYDNKCYCKTGFQGVDCSQCEFILIHSCTLVIFLFSIWFFFLVFVDTCPMDYAWADKAYAVDSAHQIAECSNQGRCNRRTVSKPLYIFFVFLYLSLTVKIFWS